MTPCRQVLMWSVPSIAVLLGIFWFRKKRDSKSDPGGSERIKSLRDELAEALKIEAEAIKSSPVGKVDQAIIKSAPIDIVPNGTNSQRSSPLQLTDEEVDQEIDKIIRKKSLEKEKKSLTSFEMQKHFDLYKNELSDEKLSASTTATSTINTSTTEEQVEIVEASTSSLIECPSLTKNVSIVQTEAQEECNENNCIEEVINVVDGESEDGELNNNVVNEPSSNNNNNRVSNAFPQQTRHISDRDSANHSPMDHMLASPSMCHFSDNHSEGSSDSGKGCSEAASPPPTNLVPSDTAPRILQFVIPQNLVGLLIGKHGTFVQQIKTQTGASVYVRRHPDSTKFKICAVEGSQSEIEAAIDMIKEKFPEKRFPNFSIQEISAELYQRLLPLVPEFLQLQLVESVNNETIITCLVSAGHFFLQQPLHPTFPSLHALHRLMATTYQNPDVPSLPKPIKEDTICAAPTENNWYRAAVISTNEETDTSVVKLVDFGGYLTVENDQLKQIRSDFMTLPFQATEALLAFVKPAKNETEWSGEALRIMAGMTAGQLLQAQVAGYDERGIPLLHLYLAIGAQQIIYINRELVDRGLAVWDMPQE